MCSCEYLKYLVADISTIAELVLFDCQVMWVAPGGQGIALGITMGISALIATAQAGVTLAAQEALKEIKSSAFNRVSFQLLPLCTLQSFICYQFSVQWSNILIGTDFLGVFNSGRPTPKALVTGSKRHTNSYSIKPAPL